MAEAVSSPARNPSGLRLLATKLLIPRARQSVVARQRLDVRLNESRNRKLTLVSAPAGFGKTTLLAEWLRNQPERACWLSLDAADNDPPRFLSYVIAGLQQVVPDVASDFVLPLRSPQPPSVEDVVTTLVNDLASAPDHITFVLDDYHVITSPAVNSAVTFLLENLPPNIHLVIATRSDPPLPIARLRSRGQVVEVRAEELRFTADEAAAFLRETMGLVLSSEQVAALDERTEGWIAGLQMAALSMRGRDDLDGFIRAFAGTNRFILDFLVEEVLSREPEAVQAFLLHTAVLNRLSGPLCDAVTGASGGQEMLDRLERGNLFVVPLDDDRRWYRYHHLFADLLRARLYQSGHDLAWRLLSRAAEWCERDGQVAEAVDYALVAKDYERAAALVVRYWLQTASDGEIETVWSWLAALPEDVIGNSAPLGVVCCWVLWLKGEVGAIEAHLVDAERALGVLGPREGDGAEFELSAALPAELAALRSLVACHHDEFEAARAHAERASGLVPENLPPLLGGQLRTVVSLALATAYERAGDLERAVGAYAEIIRLSRLGRSGTGVAVTYLLNGPQRLLGRLRAAEEACREALRFVAEHGMARLPSTGILHVALSEVLLERNDLEAAEAQLARGMELGRRSGRLDAAKNATPALVRLRLARGDTNGALAVVQAAVSALGEPPPPLTEATLLTLKARIMIRQGFVTDAARCVAEAGRLAGRDRGVVGETVGLAVCRVLLAQGNFDEAVARVIRSVAAAEGSGRWGVAIELRVLGSLALERRGDTREATTYLERALALAEPEGYVRIFLDEGAPMAELLRRLAVRRNRTEQSDTYSTAYLERLLAAFGAPDEGQPSPGPSQPGATALSSGAEPAKREADPGRSPTLVEPLTEREREVLRLLAAGLTNEQIARKLTVALGTAKTHVHNVSAKLGAQSRAHTVARARELNLL